MSSTTTCGSLSGRGSWVLALLFAMAITRQTGSTSSHLTRTSPLRRTICVHCMKRFALITTWCSDTKSPEREKEVQTSHVEHFMDGQRSTSRAHFPNGLSVLLAVLDSRTTTLTS